MRKALMTVGMAFAACALAVGVCACGSESNSAAGTGTGDNSSLLITTMQKAGEQTFETVTFGTYEQDGNTANGAEPIEWYVLDEQDGKKLLVSKYILDAVPYHDATVGYGWSTTNIRPVTDTVWEDCSLRVWLNSTFLNAAFTAEESKAIAATTVTDTKNFGTTTGSQGADPSAHSAGTTTDKVYLLSNWEARTLFDNDAARQAEATAYAKAQGCYVNGKTDPAATVDNYVGLSPWWTRTVGYYAGYAAVVLPEGAVHGDGFRQDGEYHDGFAHGQAGSELGQNFGVRPCLWVDASALK